jgi:flagellar basal body-associated protein FliL
VTAAAAVTATAAFAMFVTVVVVMAVTVTAAASVMIVVMVVIVTIRAVHVTVFQLFSRRFTNRYNFNVELQVLASQHVVTVNNYVLVVNFGNFNRYRTLIGFRQETHANLQLINAHEDVFRNALNQVFVVLAVRIVRADRNVKFVAHFMTIQRSFQAGNQGTVTMQVVQRRAYRRLINQHTVFCTYLIGQADHQVFCYFHDIS